MLFNSKETIRDKVCVIQYLIFLKSLLLGSFKQLSQFEHPYPATKVMWSPSSYTESTELLATTGFDSWTQLMSHYVNSPRRLSSCMERE